MKTQKQTINEMIAQIIAEARKLGYSEATIWRNITPKFQTVAVYYEKRGVCFYDPAITRELVDLQKERLDREEISIHYYKRVKSAANRLDEFYLTGTLRRFTKGYYIKQLKMDCQPTEFTALSRHRAVFSWAGKGGIPICGA